jgi:hypothetical protein
MKEVDKMSLIDLADSEREKNTASSDRLQRMEGLSPMKMMKHQTVL